MAPARQPGAARSRRHARSGVPDDSGAAVTIITGNQFQGGGNAGNQLQDGSALFFRRATDAGWSTSALIFDSVAGNNKYYAATLALTMFQAGDVIQYYLRLPYSDHDTTFLLANADGITSLTTADENAARAAPFTFTVDTRDRRGGWGPIFELPNVAIHTHVLPDGVVLMWGRRDRPDQSLDVDPPSPIQPGGPPAPPAQCTPFLWDPRTGQVTIAPAPTLGDTNNTNANLFCSGHAFLADGRLLVAGGHRADGKGLNQATIYDPVANVWTPQAEMNNGRWYPTALTLPDGDVVVVSGSYQDPPSGMVVNNGVPQIWDNGAWTEISQIAEGATDLYPRMHLASDGVLVMTGSQAQTWRLDVTNGGVWTKVIGVARLNGQRDYAPSVMYEVDKVIFVGGGNPPTANAETIDLSVGQPAWTATESMGFPRRQHNATLLADGTMLVTGGTRGGGFNNLDSGQPVHIAESWDPVDGRWTQLAAEQSDRCYHATAVLLPDATVLSAGGGEFFPVDGQFQPNDPGDSHRTGQIFSPPYLFKGVRPEIGSAPDAVNYGETFSVDTAAPEAIGKVTWIRLSSVTHSFNATQRMNVLPFRVDAGHLEITAPASADVCPPGHYLLFLLSDQGVPSVAKVVRIGAVTLAPVNAMAAAPRQLLGISTPARVGPLDAFAQRAGLLEAAQGTAVEIGITGTCPYGLGACWGGANEALRALEGVQFVDPIPDADNSTATVFLTDQRLPPVDRWVQQFRRAVNASYAWRGVEVSLTGIVSARAGRVFVSGDARRPAVRLAPLGPTDRIQWNRAAGAPAATEPAEAGAYARLVRKFEGATGGMRMTVTGPLKQIADGYELQVRRLRPAGDAG